MMFATFVRRLEEIFQWSSQHEFTFGTFLAVALLNCTLLLVGQREPPSKGGRFKKGNFTFHGHHHHRRHHIIIIIIAVIIILA
jgi:hypothetical protein